MDAQNMVYSDQLIVPVIKRLEAEKRPVTATEISKITGIPYGTVKRRLSELARTKVIRKSGPGRRWGSYLETNEPAIA